MHLTAMTGKEVVILYHAYGHKALYQQVLFSLLTLHYHINSEYEGLKVVIYTDNLQYFKSFSGDPVFSFELLTKEKITNFKGPDNFVHRVKIMVIKDCFEKYKANILYLDSDTYFLSNPSPLFSGINAATSIMNSNDYDLNNADELYENEDWLSIRRAVRDFHYRIDGSFIKIPLTTRMWNACVIGLSYENRKLVDAVLDLTDQIYANRPVFTAEQFSFSYFLQKKTNLISSGNVLLHYWPNFVGRKWKDLYAHQFKLFFKKTKNLSLSKQAELAYQLTTRHKEIIRSTSMRLIDRINRRLMLTWTVLRKGKIN